MKKRIVALMLCCCLLLLMLSVMALPAFAATSGKTCYCTWKLDGTALTISGTGRIDRYDESKPAPWGTEITSVKIAKGVTEIGDCSFDGCSLLTYVSLPKGLQEIGWGAFRNCASLKSIKIPECSRIDSYAFAGCSALTEIVIPQGVTKIDWYVFKDCSSLTSVTLPRSIKNINVGAFSGCSSLREVIYVGTVERLAEITVGEENDVLDQIPVYCLSIKDAAEDFDDVFQFQWFYKAVNFVYNAGLFGGTSNRRFEPEGKMTRGMVVTVLGRLSDDTVNNKAQSYFLDTDGGKWYTGSIVWATDNKIVNGLSDKLFGPNDNVTREQLCKMIVEFCKHEHIDLSPKKAKVNFADASEISKWAKSYITTCQRAGLVNGKGENKFDPRGFATRAEVATVMMNLVLSVTHIHDWGKGASVKNNCCQSTTTYTCRECGTQKKVVTTTHNIVKQKIIKTTCTTDGHSGSAKCKTCGKVFSTGAKIKKYGHNWKAATCTAPKTCTRCYKTEGSALGHHFDNKKDPCHCTRCKIYILRKKCPKCKSGYGQKTQKYNYLCCEECGCIWTNYPCTVCQIEKDPHPGVGIRKIVNGEPKFYCNKCGGYVVLDSTERLELYHRKIFGF